MHCKRWWRCSKKDTRWMRKKSLEGTKISE
jgi:hypothetical protein